MFYKYSVILSINPMADKYDNVKGKMDNAAKEFGYVSSDLHEMSIKEQLKFYIDKHLPPCHTDKVRMFELIDKL